MSAGERRNNSTRSSNGLFVRQKCIKVTPIRCHRHTETDEKQATKPQITVNLASVSVVKNVCIHRKRISFVCSLVKRKRARCPQYIFF